MKTDLFVLIACEESQAECRAFRELGCVAYSCDLQLCRPAGNPDWHIVGDVTPLLEGEHDFVTQSGIACSVPRWDLIIAHPPCTYLCKAGSRWLYENPDYAIMKDGRVIQVNFDRLMKMKEARAFFFKCLNADAEYVAVENPLPMAMASLPPPSCYACPSWFGVKYTKKTLYWLKGLPPIFPQFIYPHAKCYLLSSRGKYRSRTFPQLARAIAKQYVDFILMERRKKAVKEIINDTNSR